MKFPKFKTTLQILLVVSLIIVLGYRLLLNNAFGMASSILSAMKERRTENYASTNGNKSSNNVRTFTCRRGGSFCLQHQKEKLSKMLTNGLVSWPPPSDPEIWGHLLPPEKVFLHHKPLEDHLKAGNGTTSHIGIVGKKTGYRKGDNLTVHVSIRDGYGKPTCHGGDQIRVWMVDEELNASMATEVNDLGNGSYIAVLPLTWSGRVTVKASLVYNVAVQRAHYYARYVLKSTRYIGAGFTSPFSNELTLCSPFRKIPGYNSVCDFTDQNGGMSWFCGMPVDRTLKCRHWTISFDFDFISPLPSTGAEKQWWSEIKKTSDKKALIPLGSKIKVFVGDREDEKQKTKKLPCEKIPLRDSWYSKAPRGYFMNRKWIPMSCSSDALTNIRMNTCLQNTTVLLMGDSNAMMIFKYLASLMNCPIAKYEKREWHAPKVCNNSDIGLVARWRTHAYPFHMGSRDASDRTYQKAAHEFIDEIPDEGRFIVIVHLYIHYTAHRDDIFKTHIKAIRESVEKLLQRNPNAKVVIRGPHTFQQFWVTPKGGDIAGPAYTDYIKKAFKGIEERVLFLQPWDMTVAMENGDLHPPEYVTKAMVDVILGHLCR